ncbi:MAG: hypothetical protein M3Y72_05845 [Acidobacteriota bacterium]|nr:hypothetical protein [Acidobacteriota bacterium]
MLRIFTSFTDPQTNYYAVGCELTTEHSSSSYGIPVLVVGNRIITQGSEDAPKLDIESCAPVVEIGADYPAAVVAARN